MIPVQLVLKNFLSYRDATLDFRGLHTACICGSNGAGKSSFWKQSLGRFGVKVAPLLKMMSSILGRKKFGLILLSKVISKNIG